MNVLSRLNGLYIPIKRYREAADRSDGSEGVGRGVQAGAINEAIDKAGKLVKKILDTALGILQTLLLQNSIVA